MERKRVSNHLLILIVACIVVVSAPISFTSASSFSDEPRGFKHTGELKIQLEYNWSIWSDTGIVETFEMWIPRFTNHSHPTKTGTAPVQSSIIVSNTTNLIPVTYHYDVRDDYNNSIEYFSVTVNPGEKFHYTIVYNLTLRETDWAIRENEEGEYDTSDPIYQNLTGAEIHLEVDNSILIDLSNSICEGKASIKDKVNAIVKWMNRNLEFSGSRPPQGAYLTYVVGGGDCSDFATFFVTMCRIQGIPARKCNGVQLWNYEKQELYHNLKVGQEIVYFSNKSGNEWNSGIPGHAWTEYYIPNYGFVSLDPTFVRMNKLRYMNFMDYTYVLCTTGENQGGGVDPAYFENLFERSGTPIIENPSQSNWVYSLKFTILETDGLFVMPDWGFMLIAGGSVSIIAATVNLLIRRKRKKKAEISQKVSKVSEEIEIDLVTDVFRSLY